MSYHARRHYLNEWAGFITRAAHSGHLGGRPFGQAQGRPVQINRIQTIAGPRAGALELHAGVDAGRLLKALSADDAATLRQFVPWEFAGEPLVYMRGRYVRVGQLHLAPLLDLRLARNHPEVPPGPAEGPSRRMISSGFREDKAAKAIFRQAQDDFC